MRKSYRVIRDHLLDQNYTLFVLAEGEIEIEIEGKSQSPQIGEEVFLHVHATHTVRSEGEFVDI